MTKRENHQTEQATAIDSQLRGELGAPSDAELRTAAYFDGELDAESARAFERELESDRLVRAELADLRSLNELVVSELDAEQRDLPDARFEQIWHRFDGALARASESESAASGAQPESGGLGGVGRWFSAHLRWTAALAGAAACLGLVWVQAGSPPAPSSAPPGSDIAMTQGFRSAPLPPAAGLAQSMAESGGHPDPVDPVDPADPAGTELAGAQPAAPSSVEIVNIEFSDGRGSISKVDGGTGTTTVIWIREEEPEPDDAGRGRVREL